MTETITDLRLQRRFDVSRWGQDEFVPLAADWADFDRNGRLLHSAGGEVYAAGVKVADFSSDSPNPQPSPAWAHAWPEEFGGEKPKGG